MRIRKTGSNQRVCTEQKNITDVVSIKEWKIMMTIKNALDKLDIGAKEKINEL